MNSGLLLDVLNSEYQSLFRRISYQIDFTYPRMLLFPRLFDIIPLYRSAMLSFLATQLLKIDHDQQRHNTSFKCFLVYKSPFSPTESANSATPALPAIVTIINGFGNILTGAATPITDSNFVQLCVALSHCDFDAYFGQHPKGKSSITC